MKDELKNSLRNQIDWLNNCTSELERRNLITHILSDIDELSYEENIDEYAGSLYYDEDMQEKNEIERESWKRGFLCALTMLKIFK